MTWIKKGVLYPLFSQLPVVDDSYKDIYKIYCSRRDNQGRSLPRVLNFTKNFTPISDYPVDIPLGKPGSFDSHGIMPSSIITLEDGTKYMYYVGWSKRIDVPYWNSTGLAISKDGGVTWEKYSEGPVLASNSKDPNWIGTIDVQILEKQYWNYGIPEYRIFYSSCYWGEINGKLEPFYDIKVGESGTGRNWLLLPEKVYYNPIKLKENEGGIAACRRVGDRFFYSKRNKSDYRTNPENSYKIYSCDLYGNNEQLELEPTGDENMAAYPYIVETEDKYIMFYNGHSFGKGGISYAIKIK